MKSVRLCIAAIVGCMVISASAFAHPGHQHDQAHHEKAKKHHERAQQHREKAQKHHEQMRDEKANASSTMELPAQAQ